MLFVFANLRNKINASISSFVVFLTKEFKVSGASFVKLAYRGAKQRLGKNACFCRSGDIACLGWVPEVIVSKQCSSGTTRA